MKHILKGMSLQELENLMIQKEFQKYRAEQIYTWLYKQNQTNPTHMANLSNYLKLFFNTSTILNTLTLS